MNDASAAERRLQILSQLSPGGDTDVSGARLCEVAAKVTAVTGAGIMLMSGDIPGAAVCSTNEVSALVEDLQFSLGEGPCLDAYNQDQPILEPDLVDPDTVRWTAFSGPAVEAGVRAVFGFPLQAGTARLGALNLYCDQAGSLSHEQHAYALSVADVVAEALLVFQAAAPAGTLAPDLDVASESRWVVHQASGMLSVQLGINVHEALARLRAHAFANNQLVFEVATNVVGRQLRFDNLPGEQT